MERERESETVSSKIPKKLGDAMRTMIRMDTHLTESEFIRAAIREKMIRDAPHLFEEMFKEEKI